MGQCGGPQQAGNHPIPGLQAWRAAPFRGRRQAWAGVGGPFGRLPTPPSFFFLPHIPCDTTSHGRTPRPVPPQLSIFGPRIFYGQKKKMPHAPQIIPRVLHIFCKIRWQKRGLGENFLIFANASPAARPGVACSAATTAFPVVRHACLIYPAAPLRAPTRHSRFRRRLLNSGRPGPKRTLE
jgi:hypothetical protein